MTTLLTLTPQTWLMGFEIFAFIMIVPTVIYFTGHRLLKPFPRLFNALHLIFGGYMMSVLVAGISVLVLS